MITLTNSNEKLILHVQSLFLVEIELLKVTHIGIILEDVKQRIITIKIDRYSTADFSPHLYSSFLIV